MFTRATALLAACLVAALLASAAVATLPASAAVAALRARAAAAARGVLTAAEYQQLRAAEKRIRSLSATDTRSLRQAGSVCSRLHPVSALIAAVRTGCLDLITLGGDYGRLNNAAIKCGIDPPSEAAILTCLIPTVRSYHADAEAFYMAESRVARIARARGFTRACVAAIGDSPTNIAAEGRLAADLQATVGALRSQNPVALQTLSGRIDRDVDSIRPGRGSLTPCRHL